jgi:hypothetical protein
MAIIKALPRGSGNTISLGGVNTQTGEPNPREIKGYYLGFRVVQANGKDTKIHTFQTPKGTQEVWGKSNLDAGLAQMPLRSQVTVVQTKTEKTKNGGRMYLFDVSGDTDDVLDEPVQAIGGDFGNNAGEDANLDDVFGTDDEQESVSKPAALSASDRKAKTEALLAGGKNKVAARKN